MAAAAEEESVFVIDFSKASSSSSSLNPLSAKLRSYILQQLEIAAAKNHVKSIVLHGGGGRHFSAGADLTEFAQLTKDAIQLGKLENNGTAAPTLIDVVNAIEASPKPVVAAIAGSCLGGGLEVALACHYRVVTSSSSSSLGLPEVHVGVIPGAGGTQRLPRLVGLQQALTMILTGQPVKATRALKLGLVDDVVTNDDDLIQVATKWAKWAEVMPLDCRRLSLRPISEPPAQAHVMLHMASLQLPKRRGSEGMHAALEAIRAATTATSFEQGMEKEGELFLQVLASAQGQARRHGFFATRAAQKQKATTRADASHPLLLSNSSSTTTPPPQVAVIGAGTMGSGIALVLLQTGGFPVWLVDVSKTALDKGEAFLRKTIESYAKRGKLTLKKAEHLQSQLKTTQDLNDLRQCELVVEAVIENMKIKKSIFAQLSRITPPSCILLSNTSTLDIDEMAAVTNRPSQVAGWHFFSPAHVMPLVEIVAARCTGTDTVALLQALTKRIRKTGVVVGNCDGFCGNRMLKPYSAEMVLLLTEDGCSVEQIDAALGNNYFGFAMGPFQMADLAGNDIGYNIRKERGWVRTTTTTNDDDDEPVVPAKRPARYTELADVLVAKHGRLGQKAGKGWYDYDPAIGKGRKGLPSKQVAALIQQYQTAGPKSLVMSDDEIIARVLYPLVNEGFKCLEEGIARSPGDIDVVYLYGYGFPAWRGGPMYWADHEIGLPNLLYKLQHYARRYPDTEHYVPSKLLESCVQMGVTVEDYYKQKQQQQRSKL